MTTINILTPGFTTPNGAAFLFPLIYYKNELKKENITINFFYTFSTKIFGSDIIAIDSKFYKFLWKEESNKIFKELKTLRKETKKIIFFDTTDSSGSINSKVLPFVDLYCKSQALKNRNNYKINFYGNRIYSDYYHKNFGVFDKDEEFSDNILDPNQLKKITISWNSGLADYSLLGPTRMKLYKYFPFNFLLKFPSYDKKKKLKTINVNCRFGKKYSKESVAWQRKEITKILGSFIVKKKLHRFSYFNELKKSKIIISPFGWGEITLKDFETFFVGSLLVKPDLSHLETWPNLFISNKTFISFNWDLSDIKEKIEYILDNKHFLNEVTDYGQKNYFKYIGTNSKALFIKHFKKIIYD